MASIEEFSTDKLELQGEIKHRDHKAESDRAHEFVAARKIQAWFRGWLSRNQIRLLHKSATMIQNYWRGSIARKFVKSYLEDQIVKVWRGHYHQCAIKIQALWRGYQARRNGVNLPKYQEWLQTIYDKNNQTLTEMKQFRNLESTCMKTMMERESMLWIVFILFKLHHLLRTQCQIGVLTRTDKAKFAMIEKMIQSLEYTSYMEKGRRDKCNKQRPPDPPLLFKGTYFARCEREIRDLEKSMKMGNASIHRDTLRSSLE